MPSDPHYIQKIVALGEKQRVVTHRPVLNEHGVKLIDSGVHISEALYDKLVLHKLLPPIDECLTVDNAVTASSLAEEIKALAATETFGSLLPTAELKQKLFGVFAHLPLNPVLAFKLTVAREQTPQIFRHSLEVALCATALAMPHPGIGARQLSEVAAAGLFHDLGLLHINTDLLHTENPLSDEARQHIYSHPIAAHLILDHFPEWHPRVSRAVLEHHEREDGSGYPRGLAGKDISPLGQLLAVAEVAATLLSRRRSIPRPEYVHVILRLNHDKLNRDIASTLMTLVMQEKAHENSDSLPETPYAEILSDLVTLAEDLQNWHSIAQPFGQLPMVALINERVAGLERSMAGIGLDLQYWGMVDAELSEDEHSLHELEAAAREGKWQMRAIAQEVRRKWKPLCPPLSAQEDIQNWLKRIEEA